MPMDYTQAELMSDMMTTITSNAPLIISAGIILGVANFMIVWFMHIVFRGLRP